MDGTSPVNVGMYAVLLFLMGLCIAAAAPACNNPVFAEIVPPELRNMVRSHCAFQMFIIISIIWLGKPNHDPFLGRH